MKINCATVELNVAWDMTFKSLGQRPKKIIWPSPAFRQVKYHQLLFIGSETEVLEIGTLFMLIKLNFFIETKPLFPLAIWLASYLEQIIEASVDMSETSYISKKPICQANHMKIFGDDASIIVKNHRSGDYETYSFKDTKARSQRSPIYHVHYFN